jgi:replicative DNA helicase
MKEQFPDIPGLIPSLDIVQSTGKTVSWMVSQIEMHEPDIVVSDSFYRQAAEDKRHDGDWRGITSVSRALKDAAMDTNVVMIGTHQMNRGAEEKVGTLSNMALADAVGQDADLIMRVVTGKIEGHDRSALLVLGGREVPFDGIMINNKPCYDFTEIGEITDRRQVMELLGEQDEDSKKARKGKADNVAKKAGKKAEKEDTTAPENSAQTNE